MKKIISLFALVSFLAVNVSLAQSTNTEATQKETKTESVKPEATTKSMHSCCKKSAGMGCGKAEAASKNCSPKEKAACKDMEKSEAKGVKAEAKQETKSGTN